MQYINNYNEVIFPDWMPNRNYSRGSAVRYDNVLYVCDIPHMSDKLFQDTYWTSYNTNGGGGNSVPTLTEISKTVIINSNKTEYIDINIPYNKCDIRTMYAYSDKTGNIQLKIFESAAASFCCYTSNLEPKIYDLINMPYIDTDNTKSIHASVFNQSSEEITVTIIIKITNFE